MVSPPSIGAQEDPYAGFADRYDRFHEGFGQYDPVEVAFFRDLFGQGNVASILDCACGTGRHLPLFQSLGCEVVGTDISPSMLARASQNLGAWGAEIPLHQVDYRALHQHFSRRFDAIACLSSSILHMPCEGEVLKALRSMRRVLRQGGLLILTQGTTDKQWREKPRFILAASRPDLTRLFAIDYVGSGAHYHVLDVVHTGQGYHLEVWSFEYPKIYLRDDYEHLLEAAGFGAVDFYGTYDFEPYDKGTSNHLIVVAHR